MASIIDILYDLSGTIPYKNADIACYTSASQPDILTGLDGVAVEPVGAAVTSTLTSDLGEYKLDGLTAGVSYDLFVTPNNGPAFWIPDRVPDAEPTATPCILYGSVDTSIDLVYAFLEYPAVVLGGVHLDDGATYSTVSKHGAFSLSLWPTSSLTPPSLYRVHIGASIYRGVIPGDGSINLSDWLALSTTLQLA